MLSLLMISSCLDRAVDNMFVTMRTMSKVLGRRDHENKRKRLNDDDGGQPPQLPQLPIRACAAPSSTYAEGPTIKDEE
jgi:hypothetical protein